MKSTLTSFLIDLELPGSLAFSTVRENVKLSDPYSGLSACHYVGDDEHSVAESRRLIADAIGLPPDRLLIPRQTHSLNIAIIDDSFSPATELSDIDGMVSRRSDVALCINTADCVPLLLSDPVSGVIAAIHSGWRGSVGRIAAKAVETMCLLGALPHNIHAAMGPSICGSCYEVGEEVAGQFRKEFPFVPGVIIEQLPRPHVDLVQAIRATLIDAGLPTGNISDPIACSRCNPDRFFSARVLGVESGRTLSGIRRLS